ncbi:MAG: hypothetical protein ACJAQ6_001347 [Arenicella sp.]|jgi:hypothetical protein
MLSTLSKIGLAGLILLSAACSQQQVANRGFSLPDGDADNGRQLLLDYQCTQCHTIAGAEFSKDELRLTASKGIAVKLGGESSRIQTYGDLVTSIINPSHRIAKGYPSAQVTYPDGVSKMQYYNQVMTVEELVDLVTFLKLQYKFKSYPETSYPHYLNRG